MLTRIIIAGSREFNNYDLLCKKCALIPSIEGEVEIISGHARGADTLGERFAKEHKVPLKIMPAEWNKYGKRAGIMRNAQMAIYASKADNGYLVAFKNGNTPGTMNMIETAQRYGLTIYIVETQNNKV